MAQEARVPADLVEQIDQRIQQRVQEVVVSILRNATITGGKGLTVSGAGGITIDGGAFRVTGQPGAEPGTTGDSTVYMGGITPAMPDGTLQPGLIIRREDGTIALALYDPTPDPAVADGFNQYLALFDRAQTVVLADDTPSGQGLSRPFIPIPLTLARYTDMVAVTTDWVDVFDSGFFYKVNARALASIRHTTDVSGTTGEIRVLVDDVQVGGTVSVGFVVTTQQVGPFVVPGDAYSSHRIKVQARRTAGTGAVRLDASIWGVQS